MSRFEVRTMRWTDLAEVHDIELASFPDSAWSQETFWAELARSPETRDYWVAESGGAVIGYVGLMVIPPDGDIQTIAVSAQHRRTGVASRLLEVAIDQARARTCRWLMLEVAADNQAARQLYEHRGFEQLALRRSYYGPGRDAVVMRLRLAGTSASSEASP